MSDIVELTIPPRRRRWFPRIVGLLVLSLGVLTAFAPTIVAKTPLRDVILNRILSGSVLAGTLSSDTASWSWLSPITFSGVTILSDSGQPLATGGTLTSSFTLLTLIRSDGDYGEFTLTHPTLMVECRTDGTNIEDLIAPILAPSDQPETGDRVGVIFRIQEGQLQITGGTATPVPTFDFTVTVPRPRSEAVTLTYQIRGTGHTTGEWAFGSPSTVKLTAQDFAIDSLAPLIHRFQPEMELHGLITADVSCAWGTSADGQPTLTVAGRTDVAQLDLLAPGWGGDRIRLQQAGLPIKLTRVGDVLTVESVKLACDVGVVTGQGVLDLTAPWTQLLERPGQSLSADVDLAKLARLVPNLMRLRDGTELHAGRVTVEMATATGKNGQIGWQGTLDTQSLQGTRAGRTLAWDQPLQARFSGRTRDDGMPIFDNLECQSDFASLAARGSPESLEVTAKIDWDRLTRHLREFVDLGTLQLSGTADVALTTVRKGDRDIRVEGTAQLERFVIDNGSGQRLEEPQLRMVLNATGQLPGQTPARIDTGTLQIGAGKDRLELVLREPLTEPRAPQSGKLLGHLSGDLARWQTRLGRWVTLPAEWKLSGTTDTNVIVTINPKREFTVSATANVSQLTFRDTRGKIGNEPQAQFTVETTGRILDTDAVRVDTGTVALLAGKDRLDLKLLDPIADIQRLGDGRFSTQITGDLSRWRNRLRPWYELPAEWRLAGTGTLKGTVAMSSREFRADSVQGTLQSLRFQGIGLLIHEPEVQTNGRVVLHRPTGSLTLSDWQLSSGTASLAARSVVLNPTSSGGLTGGGTVAVTANLQRLLPTVGLDIPDPSLAVTGLASGSVGFDLKPDGNVSFDSQLAVEKLVIGPEKNPTWTEPKLAVTARGDWGISGEKLTFTSFRGGRDGLFVDGKGTITDLSNTVNMLLDGSITYDLARLEPTLRNYLGRGATISGSGTRPFALRGPLNSGGKDIALQVGEQLGGPSRPSGAPRPQRPQPSPLDQLTGNASVGWKAIRAFGFQVGPAELAAAMVNGSVKLSPIEAAFGGGKVRVHPTLTLNAPRYDLAIAPGRIVEKANLTPDTLNGTLGALGYALPALADVAQAKGQVSFDLVDAAKIPLADTNQASVKGTLTVHSAEVTPGPLITEILTLLNADKKVLATAAEQSVPIVIKDGIVYHSDFKLNVGRTVVTTRGGVGLDGKLVMQLVIPFPPAIADTLFQNNPRIRETLLKQEIRLPITGTVGKPRLDPVAFRNAVQQLVRDATRDAAGNLLGDLLRKGLRPQP
ncbi:MAG: hypothetical protein LC104_06140 [Bacteroidales bacterium]|nr:hypothetical protein [Bacteroidales bacterium]